MNTEKENMRICSVYEKDFVLDGLYFEDGKDSFRRIPQGAFVSEVVNELAGNPAGVMLRFQTDSTSIAVRAELGETRDTCADHMAMTGGRGFDLYMGRGKEKRFAGVSRFPWNATRYTSVIYSNPDPERKMVEYTLHFPLYAPVKSFELLLDPDAKTAPPSPWKDPRPIVVYGTSIQQGGCASRPGMCHTNRMSRILDKPFLNFSFSGGAKGEEEIAHILASITDPALYILDYDANAGVEGLKKTLRPMIDILRASHPDTPILLVSKTFYGKEFDPGNTAAEEERNALTAVHQLELLYRREQGDENIFFLDGRTLYDGADPSECTVDGAHATDLGFYFIAENMSKKIRSILENGSCSA